jgi:hypothetical protein
VHWDVEVTNQDAEVVAVYTILTLVRQRRGAGSAVTESQLEGALASVAPAELTVPARMARTEPDSAPVRVV